MATVFARSMATAARRQVTWGGANIQDIGAVGGWVDSVVRRFNGEKWGLKTGESHSCVRRCVCVCVGTPQTRTFGVSASLAMRGGKHVIRKGLRRVLRNPPRVAVPM